MGRRKRSIAVLPAVAALLAGSALAPTPVAASDEFSSSMQAFCYTEDCSIIQFNLELVPAAYVSFMSWTVRGSALEQGIAFNSSTGSTIETDVGTWSVTWVTPGEIQLNAGGEPTLTPSWFRLAMDNVDDHSQLNTGEAIRYNGFAYETLDDYYAGENQISFSGYAVPEPVTLLLMGTGLIGVVGAGARRKRYLDA